MYPLLFNSYSIYPFALMAIAPAPILFLLYLLRREGVSPASALKAMLLLLLVALVGGKLFSLMSRGWPDELSLAAELSGGMRFSGIVIGVILVLPLVRWCYFPRLNLARGGDIIAMTLVVAVSAGRLACVLQGCCIGARGESLLHLSYPAGSWIWYKQLHAGVIDASQQVSEPVLALHFLFLFASLLAAIVLLKFDGRRRYDGQILVLFLVLHELPKAGLELLRAPLVPEQLSVAAVAGVVGLLALIYFRFSPPEFERA
jgi:prolipoprotein diacylglyceryltransferase